MPVSFSVNAGAARRRGDEQVRRLLQERERVDGLAAVRVHLEMQVRVDAVRVAGVADVADRLAGVDVRSVRRRRTTTPWTHLPWLSFAVVRSLFRWMYSYIVPLAP